MPILTSLINPHRNSLKCFCLYACKKCQYIINILLLFTIKVYLSNIYCSNYRTDKQSIWCHFCQNRKKVNWKCGLIHPRCNMIIYLFFKHCELYTVLVMMHRNSSGTSLDVSLYLKPGHFPMLPLIDMWHY